MRLSVLLNLHYKARGPAEVKSRFMIYFSIWDPSSVIVFVAFDGCLVLIFVVQRMLRPCVPVICEEQHLAELSVHALVHVVCVCASNMQFVMINNFSN